jgi:O-antigen/teichoic acid export membrane protein
MASFICFPVAAITIVAAPPLVKTVLTDKFSGSIPILQILALYGAIYPLYVLSSALLKALGKSGLILKTEIIRNTLLVASALLLFRFGILAMVAGFTGVHIIAFVIAFYFSGRYISYRLTSLFRDILPYAGISFLVFAPLSLLGSAVANSLLLLALQTLIGGCVYLLIIRLLGSKVMEDCLSFIRNRKI